MIFGSAGATGMIIQFWKLFEKWVWVDTVQNESG
jgi:hypothetical protein